MSTDWWHGLASGLCGVGLVCLLLLVVDFALEKRR